MATNQEVFFACYVCSMIVAWIIPAGGHQVPVAQSRSTSPDPKWMQVPIRPAVLAALGLRGGEGCQVVRALAVARANPDALLLGADVGGVYRSLDGGGTWAPAMVGWNSRGATAFAFDDGDWRHVLGVGGNSASIPGTNGLHVSFDGAASWEFVLPIADAVGCLDGSAVAWDPPSFNTTLNVSTTAYFSSEAGLWRSVDAGRTWKLINAALMNACLAVDSHGRLFAASNDYRSFGFYACGTGYDGTSGNCSRARPEYTTGIDVARDGSDAVFISNWAGVMKSTDHGSSFSLLGCAGLPHPGVTPMRHVAVSPADPQYLAAWYAIGPAWNTTFVYSHDGGATFGLSAFNNSLAIMPFNGRDGKPVWHPLNTSVMWNAGGDWVTRSTDGGAVLEWSSSGYAVVMTGGAFAFNIHAPQVLFLAFQDYAGAVTLDAGSTWAYVGGAQGISGDTWGGFDYGGFALNASVLWAGDAPSWGGPRTLRISYDMGKSWRTVNNSATGQPAIFAGPDVSSGDPLDPSVGFASNWRTANGGASWAPMPSCAAVLTADGNGAGLLFGVSAGAAGVVQSSDHGQSWTLLFTSPAGAGTSVLDVAFDWKDSVVYVVAANTLFKCSNSTRAESHIPMAPLSPSSSSSIAASWSCETLSARLPPDQQGGMRVVSVAVDPVVPSTLYVAATRDIFLASNAVARSTDSGLTFTNLILSSPLQPGPDAPLQGPHEVSWVRVHPRTRWLWAVGECFGVWTAPPPQ